MSKRSYFQLRYAKRLGRSRKIVVGLIILILIISSLFAYKSALEYYAERVIADSIEQLVEAQTDGAYSFKYDSISISIWKQSIYLTQFELTVLKDSVDDERTAKVFEFNSQELTLGVDKLFALWLNSELNVKEVTITSPTLNILSKPSSGNTKVAKLTGELFKELNSYLINLNIDILVVDNARISFYREKIKESNLKVRLNDLSLSLYDFRWKIDKVFDELESGDFNLSLKNQNFMVSDSMASIYVDELSYALDNNSLVLEGGKFKPLRIVDGNKTYDSVSVVFDELAFTGINLQEIYNNNVLILDSVKVSTVDIKPEHDITFLQNLVQRKDSSKALIDSLFVSDISFTKATIDYEVSNTFPFSVNHWNAEIRNFSIGGEIQGNYYYEKSDFLLEGIRGRVEKINHAYTLDRLTYSSELKTLELDSLKLWYDDESLGQADLKLNITAPKLMVTGVHEAELLSKNIDIDSLYFKDPSISIEHYPVKRDTATQQSPWTDFLVAKHLLLDSAFIFYKSTNTQIELVHALLDFRNIDYEQRKFNLDSTLQYSIKLPKANFRSSGSQVSIANFEVSSSSTLLSTSTLTFSNQKIDLLAQNVKVVNNNPWIYLDPDSLHLSHLSFENYEIDFNLLSKQGNAEKSFPLIKVDSINTTEGSISIESTSIEKLEAQVNSLVLKDLWAAEGSVKLSDIDFELTEVDGTTDSSTFNIARVRKVTGTSTFEVADVTAAVSNHSTNYNLRLPMLKVTGYSLNNIPEDFNEIRFDQLALTTPTIVHTSTGSNSSTTSNIKEVKLPNVKFNTFTLNKGNVKSTSPAYTQALRDIDITLRDIDLNRSNTWFDAHPEELLYTRELEVKIDSFFHVSAETQVNVADFEVKKGNLSASKVSYHQQGQDTIHTVIDQLSVDNLLINKLVLDNSLIGQGLTIENIDVSASLREKESSKTLDINPVIDLSKIVINKASLDIKRNEKENLFIDPISLSLENFYYDSLVDFSEVVIPAKSIDLKTGDLSFVTSDGLNKIQVDALSLKQDQTTFSLENIRLTPLLEKQEYFKTVGEQTDWITGYIPKVEIKKFDIKKFLQDRSFFADKLIIHKPVLEVERDKNYPFTNTKERPLPATLLRELKTAVSVDSILLEQGSITYAETPEEGVMPGIITFKEMNANFSNVTNIASELSLNPIMNVNVDARVMGVPEVIVSFKFDLSDPQDRFTLRGGIEEHDMTVHNAFTKEGAFLQINSGECKAFTFSAEATNDVAIGSMDFEYNDLKVALVDKETSETKKIKESVVSFMANTFIVKKRNMALINLREGQIFYERNKLKSIFNYWSKLFTTGVASSVGVKNYKRNIRKWNKKHK